jgi:antimicrobial peptide system SdpA family protein
MWPRSAPERPPPDPGRADQRLGRAVVIVAALVSVIIVYVLYAALPATAFGLPFNNPRAVKLLVPEGWAFFTKSPLSPEPDVYGFSGGRWHLLNAGPQATLGNLMGLNRLDRSQGTELAILMVQVPPRSWSSCQQAPVACLSRLPLEGTVSNTSTHHTACGDVGLVVQQVLPWAWRNLNVVMPSRVVRVNVTC